MAQNYYWSKSKVSFYPVVIKSWYVAAGTFPSDAVLVDDSVFEAFGLTSAPEGEMRGVDSSGNPTWVTDTTS